MLKVMQYVFPLIVQVEMDVIKKFGFTDNREGSLSIAHNFWIKGYPIES